MKIQFKLKNFKIQFLLNRVDRINSLTVFNYHQIGEHFNAIEQSRGTFTESTFFEEQMVWLNNNYKIVKLSDGLDAMNRNALDGQSVAITFDDGDKSNIEAMQILKKHNIPATFFVNSGYLDNRSAYWFNIYNFVNNSEKYRYLLTDELETNVKQLRNTNDNALYKLYSKKVESLFDEIKDDFNVYLSLKDLERMDSDLFDVSLHGCEHQRFSMMSSVWQRESILKDINALSQLKNYKPIFAIPFGRPGDWSRETIKIALELGLDIVFADEGVNYHREVGCKRIPADGRELKVLM